MANPKKIDPTQTLSLRNSFDQKMGSRFYKLRAEALKRANDMRLGVEAPAFEFVTDKQKIAGFTEWFKKASANNILSTDFIPTDLDIDKFPSAAFWTNDYVESAYKKGIRDSLISAKNIGQVPPGLMATATQDYIASYFLAPVAKKNIEKIYTRTFKYLRNVTEDMDKEISGILSRAILDGSNPLEISKSIALSLSGDKGRTDLINRLSGSLSPESSKTSLEAAVAQSLKMGDTPTQMARRLLDNGVLIGNDAKSISKAISANIDRNLENRGRAIARTEVIYAYNEAALDNFENLDIGEVEIMAEWSTALDSRVCDLCQPLEGAVMTIQQARGLLPRHVNCVVGESKILAANPLAIMRAKYTGEIVKISTSDGGVLSVTSNHVMLTQKGWVKACEITDSDYLFDATKINSSKLSIPHKDDAIPGIEDCFSSFEKCFGISTTISKSSPVDLHGDGESINGKIDIIDINSFLGGERNIEVNEVFSNSSFSDRNSCIAKASFLHLLRSNELTLSSLAAASDCFMGFDDISGIFSRGSFGHHNPIGSGIISNFDSSGNKSFADDISSISESLAKLILRNPGLIKIGHFINDIVTYFNSFPRNSQCLGFSSDNTGFFEFLSNCLSIVSEDGGNLSAGKSALIERDCFVKINSVSYSHVDNLFVYDLSTQETLYTINGYLSSNCRCSYLPHKRPEKPKAQEKLRKQAKNKVSASIILDGGKSKSTWEGKNISLGMDAPNKSNTKMKSKVKSAFKVTSIPKAKKPYTPPYVGEFKPGGDIKKYTDIMYKDNINELMKNTTFNQRESLRNYGGSNYREINRGLRSNSVGKLNKTYRDDIQNIDKIFASAGSESTKQQIVYRVIGSSDAHSVGKEFIEKGYSSTTFDIDKANEFARGVKDPVIYRINLPKGTRSIPMQVGEGMYKDPEREILLNRGMKFKVLGELKTSSRHKIYNVDVTGAEKIYSVAEYTKVKQPKKSIVPKKISKPIANKTEIPGIKLTGSDKDKAIIASAADKINQKFDGLFDKTVKAGTLNNINAIDASGMGKRKLVGTYIPKEKSIDIAMRANLSGIKIKNGNNWCIAGNTEESVIHEIGHSVFYAAGPSKMSRWTDYYKMWDAQEVTSMVSVYGATNEHEMFAEVFCGLMTGRKYDDMTMKAFTEVISGVKK